MRVKICGITQLDQGQAIAQLGATALGFICVPQSPRYIPPAQIQAIATHLDPSVERVGVFANAELDDVIQVVAIAQLTAVQLHGSESPQFCQQLRTVLPQIELIKAFRIRDADTLAQTRAYTAHVDTLLFDAYHPHVSDPGQLGGTGTRFDWRMLQSFRPSLPWLLAGGITPDNVLDALQVHPDGIDLSSGVERAPGDKDLAAVATLFANLQCCLNVSTNA